MKQAVLGLIGAGYLANAQHLPNLMFTPHARLKTVCDLNGEAARAAAEKFHIPCVETDARKVFADPEIDGVVIVTREDQHAPLAIAALEAGKHVYVEKPLADTRENCRKVVDAETRTGKRVAVGFNRRYAPALRKAREIVEAHGGPHNVHYRMADSYHYTWGKNYPPGVRLFHETCHIFDLFRWFTRSEPESIYCVDSRPDDEIIVVRMKSGCVCSILSSGYASIDTPKEAMEVVADRGMLMMEHFVEMHTYGWTDAEDTYRFKGHAHPDLDTIYRWVFEDLGADAFRSFHRHWTRMVWQPERNPADDPVDVNLAKHFKDTHDHATGYHVDKGWVQALDHFAECMITGEKPDTATARDGLIAELMGEACKRSRDARQPVTCDW
ncbi:MAG TPA: Gfo/Idh/MocA family oxidoreductase [Planctomycetota bacterium]|nr:Gfo/Idh/MocA family oxidoreductase [Planctomycetota bacterium]